MTKELILLGASGSTRDIIELVEANNAKTQQWKIAGILDDDVAKQGQKFCDVPVLGAIGDAPRYDGFFVNGIASARNRQVRRRIVDRLGFGPARYATLIHPTASISPRAMIGAGVVLLDFTVIGPQAHIGDHVLVCAASTIGHDARLETCATLSPSVGVSGGVKIGASAYLGSGARIKDGVTVGEGALVGIGAVIIDDVPDGATMFGNPARQVG